MGGENEKDMVEVGIDPTELWNRGVSGQGCQIQWVPMKTK